MVALYFRVPNHMGYPEGCDWNPCSEHRLLNFTEFVPFDKDEHYHKLCSIKDWDNQLQVFRHHWDNHKRWCVA